jgi:hypothetical protein
MLRRRVEPDDEDLLELVGGVGATVNVKVLDIEEVRQFSLHYFFFFFFYSPPRV